jgi:hypothetical protein
VEGAFAEIETETFGLWVKPPEGTILPSNRSAKRVVRVIDDDGKPIVPAVKPPEAPSRLLAEQEQSVLPGDTVYVQDTSGQTLEGLVAEITSSHLTIRCWDGQAGTVTIPLSDVRRIELETTMTKSRAGRGALIGLGAGLGLSALMFAACDTDYCAEAAPALVGAVLMGTGIGLLFGRKRPLFPGARSRCVGAPDRSDGKRTLLEFRNRLI